MTVRAVTEADVFAADMRDLLAAIREHTDATKRLVDELVRERAERRQGRAAGAKRSATIRARAVAPLTVAPEAHAAAERAVARLGRR
jgi:hypothetical protein